MNYILVVLKINIFFLFIAFFFINIFVYFGDVNLWKLNVLIITKKNIFIVRETGPTNKKLNNSNL